jgi:CSN8/PSMD8/EIF3K family
VPMRMCAHVCFVLMCTFHAHSALTYAHSTRNAPPSPRKYLILGLNLLRLLAHQQFSEFHTELQLISIENLSKPEILHSLKLERSMVEGSYTQVFSAQHQVPEPSFTYFMNILMDTTRFVLVVGIDVRLDWFCDVLCLRCQRPRSAVGFSPCGVWCDCSVVCLSLPRNEIASCLEAAYKTLPLPAAQQMLSLQTDEEFSEFVKLV